MALSVLSLLAPAPAGAAAPPNATGVPSIAEIRLGRTLERATRHTGTATGVLVVDLSTRRTLWSLRPTILLLPASTEKLYTTAALLESLGPRGALRTRALATAEVDAGGTLAGNLYVRGAGDPTLGGERFNRRYYGGVGTTVEDLAAAVAAAGVRRITGRVIGDEGQFDELRGTPTSHYRRSSEVTGQLSALVFDRGLDPTRSGRFQPNPPAFTAARLATALRQAHVKVQTGGRAGATPARARQLAFVDSPPVSTLIRMTNSPSDNFFAETLLKAESVAAGDPIGSTVTGTAQVGSYLDGLGIHPRVADGSGLSRQNRSSAFDLVRVLQVKQDDGAYRRSLPVAGSEGTLRNRMHGTAAAGHCRAKTGTLHDVSNLAGYCTSRSGHLLAFAVMMNRTQAWLAHPVQDEVAAALARYAG